MEISEPVFDRLSFEHYIRLEDSYKYNILLLCRIEGNTVRYGYWANIMNRVRYIFLNGMNEITYYSIGQICFYVYLVICPKTKLY